MKFKLRRLAAIAAVGFTIFFGGNSIADAANITSGAMQAFRRAYVTPVPDTRVFEQDITLISTNFHLDIDSRAQVLKDGSLKIGGQLNWNSTNLKNDFTTNSNIPFYVEQVGNEMTLYVKRNSKWSKISLPGFPTGLAILWKTTDPKILNGVTDAAKSVEIINNTPDLITMNVTLDGTKIANILNENSAKTFAKLSGDALDAQKKNFYRWLSVFRKTDITFTWTVNKPSWTTATAIFDLTPIMRAYAIKILDESAAGRIVLTDEERDLLDAIGYYSELRSYVTRIAVRDDTVVNLPDDLKAAPENDDSLNDILSDMTKVVDRS